MAIDIMILNTAVADFRSDLFGFVEELVGVGGLASCQTKEMPDYSQRQYGEWVEQGIAAAGGPGNTAPLIARAGIKVAVGVNLGRGEFNGLDAQGRLFWDVMLENNVDMSQTFIHPDLPTGTTFIYDKGCDERGGIAYFPNANDDFDFDYFKIAVEKLKPRIIYYMYSGLSESGDANGGHDLADFMRWCRMQGCLTIADSHTLCANPQDLIQSGEAVDSYKLLEPLLPELDIFFTSSDEVCMIINTLVGTREWSKFSEKENHIYSLDVLRDRYASESMRMRLFGITTKDGAFETHITHQGEIARPSKVSSRFMCGDVIDLVGAGDSVRAGLVAYGARNADAFSDGTMDVAEAVQMGNLFASLFIKAPLNDRYGNIQAWDSMLNILRNRRNFSSMKELLVHAESVTDNGSDGSVKNIMGDL